MSLESDVRDYLLSKAALTALVGTRIYAIHLPQSPTYPNIVYQVVSHDPHTTMDSAGTIHRDRLMFDIRSESYAALLQVETQLVSALNTAVRKTDGFVAIHLSTTDMPYEPNVERFRRIVDYALWSQP